MVSPSGIAGELSLLEVIALEEPNRPDTRPPRCGGWQATAEGRSYVAFLGGGSYSALAAAKNAWHPYIALFKLYNLTPIYKILILAPHVCDPGLW
ncbi:hypothetical protein KDA_35520 [Dictyobacter alpinus]|uniref:Uncharacterized protein n=1 Tax=Dictyobacter alpinus TaxID=2014873 RepID=A0A402B9M2_9CHLR|nr:hypothetical protein KDA_35520 [Dictyobacter alpinus]